MAIFTGYRQLEIVDHEQSISFPAMVLYPTIDTPEPKSFGPYQMTLAADAAVAGGPYSLVIISHGSGGHYLAYRTYAESLVQAGFVVCLPQHPFDNRFDRQHKGKRENLLNRPRHIGLAIQQTLADVHFAAALKADSVAVIGHSLGGYTALAAAGAKPDPGHDLTTAGDRCVKAIVLLDPGGIELFDWKNGFSKVKAAILMCFARYDGNPYQYCIETLSRLLPEPQQLDHRLVDNAGHYSFLSPFPPALVDRVGPAARDPQGFDREAFHRQLHQEIAAFLSQHL